MADQYHIKSGYSINVQHGKPKVVYTKAPKGTHFQIAVYKEVREYILKHQIKNVVDFGCGSGYKLNKYITNLKVSVCGVDQNFAIEEGRNKYPSIHWIEDDFASETILNYGKFDVIISADVIEHLVDPDKLIDRIRTSAHRDSIIFISTPERDLVRGESDYGPPENPKHVREWNFSELEKYLTSKELEILDHKILPAKKLTFWETLKNLAGIINNETCQMVVCKLKA